MAIHVPELSRGRVKDYEAEQIGLCRKQRRREQWVQEARNIALEMRLPLVLVGPLSGESWGKWLAAVERVFDVAVTHETTCFEARDVKMVILRVSNPGRWLKGKEAVRFASTSLDQPDNLSEKIAEALCIRVWASSAAELRELLSTKRKKAA